MGLPNAILDGELQPVLLELTACDVPPPVPVARLAASGPDADHRWALMGCVVVFQVKK